MDDKQRAFWAEYARICRQTGMTFDPVPSPETITRKPVAFLDAALSAAMPGAAPKPRTDRSVAPSRRAAAVPSVAPAPAAEPKKPTTTKS